MPRSKEPNWCQFAIFKLIIATYWIIIQNKARMKNIWNRDSAQTMLWRTWNSNSDNTGQWLSNTWLVSTSTKLLWRETWRFVRKSSNISPRKDSMKSSLIMRIKSTYPLILKNSMVEAKMLPFYVAPMLHYIH